MKKSKSLVSLISIIIITAILFSLTGCEKTPYPSEISILSDIETHIDLNIIDDSYTSFLLFDSSDNWRYAYTFPLDDKGEPPVNMSYTGAFDSVYVDINYAILTFKNDGMHSYKLDEHALDQLVFLNDKTKNADVLYETHNGDRIIYGNKDYVIIYRIKSGTIQYISITDGTILKEIQPQLRNNYSYCFEIKKDKNAIEINGYSVLMNILDFSASGKYDHYLTISKAV